jgi:hypothetical protein
MPGFKSKISWTFYLYEATFSSSYLFLSFKFSSSYIFLRIKASSSSYFSIDVSLLISSLSGVNS